MTHQHHMWCKPGDPCWPAAPRKPHAHNAWCQHRTPLAIRWWLTNSPRELGLTPYGHYGVLLDLLHGGRSADDMEALDFCFRTTVLAGGGDLHGNLCVCLREDPPSAGEARGSIGSDGFSALLSLKADLEHAADQLPISWTSTQQVFETQGRAAVYQQRLSSYRRNERVRDIDRWLEPRDPETRRPASRALVYFQMAVALGSPVTCRWPRKARIEALSETALAHELKEAA